MRSKVASSRRQSGTIAATNRTAPIRLLLRRGVNQAVKLIFRKIKLCSTSCDFGNAAKFYLLKINTSSAKIGVETLRRTPPKLKFHGNSIKSFVVDESTKSQFRASVEDNSKVRSCARTPDILPRRFVLKSQA